ncbi:hypothetical protein N7468_010249 [Penicillium chermesinum]|uniref:Allergen Asp f 4 n=1 Tax=Penicillium chermesinum TaxID=63820 RepID=A0A9W9NCB7_9EURO|nr:uncharacterized protein N7468_010249 [Penicillium chermesinum]KAJ5217241.1 hypothetical protein N7468_010249 [Penicillium chermesinum]KAJ6171143.1 hypothetical protein N7470_000210 [Penicillium chermesinum]
MHFSKSLTLLAALSSSALARVESHGRRHAHHPRDVATVTLTSQLTVTVCPCESTTFSTAAIEATTSEPTTTSTTVLEYTSTSSSEYTSTSTPDSTPTTTAEPTTSVVATTSTSSIVSTTSSGASADWTSVPSDGVFSTSGFGGVSTPYNLSSNVDTYVGNVGIPYGSNIQEVSASDVSSYKYVVQFTGSNTEDWTVKIWNKIGPDGQMDGWFGKACHSFTLAAGETRYWAFDENSQGGWAAAAGATIPVNWSGQYSATWGEFDFGNQDNKYWSGYDVSAITAKASGDPVQGMRICDALNSATRCSSISSGGSTVTNAYYSDTQANGLGGNLFPGAVRLSVEIDWRG